MRENPTSFIWHVICIFQILLYYWIQALETLFIVTAFHFDKTDLQITHKYIYLRMLFLNMLFEIFHQCLF